MSALDKLQQRNFKPALGGLEIPFTPNSLLGGGKRVSQLGSSSRDVGVVASGAAAELREEIEDKRLLIQNLTEELQGETDTGQRALTTETLSSARADLAQLVERLRVLADEHRRING
ncbi:type III effector [Ralstonia syzygii]|uniref:Type III effector n=1 Tax=Ralstonia syzygii TaxID=28097 RepID=A0ABX7ZJB7_9RALS|nr:type III effector [Ralstonia syzygii]